MTDLEKHMALAISPQMNEKFPEEWLPEAQRAIRAFTDWLEDGKPMSTGNAFGYDQPSDSLIDSWIQDATNPGNRISIDWKKVINKAVRWGYTQSSIDHLIQEMADSVYD